MYRPVGVFFTFYFLFFKYAYSRNKPSSKFWTGQETILEDNPKLDIQTASQGVSSPSSPPPPPYSAYWPVLDASGAWPGASGLVAACFLAARVARRFTTAGLMEPEAHLARWES